MNNRRGEGYVLPCVLVLAMSMVASMLIVFATSISVVRYTEDNVALTLDRYVMLHSVEIYNAIKQGSNAIDGVDQEAYVAQLCQFASLERQGQNLYARGDSYHMTVPELNSETDTLQLTVRYTQFVPIRFFGTVMLYARVPVTVTSALTSKF